MIIPRAILLAGLALVVFLVCRNVYEMHEVRQEREAERQSYQRQVAARERCAEALKRSGKYGELVDLEIEGLCPLITLAAPVDADTFSQRMNASRAATLEQAGLILLLSSLPWLANRWTRARARLSTS